MTVWIIRGVVVLIAGVVALVLGLKVLTEFEVFTGQDPPPRRVAVEPPPSAPDRDRDGRPDARDDCPDAFARTPDGCPPPPPPATEQPDTLSDLKRMGDAPDLDFTVGDYGVQRIGGENYEHGVSMLVYPEDPDDGSGVPDLRIETDGRYARMSGYVGIDDDASDDCAGASVSITDGNDEQLWPPEGGELKVYGDDADPERFSFRMDRPEQVKLVQRSLAESEDDGCGGSANPAWGKFLFFP